MSFAITANGQLVAERDATLNWTNYDYDEAGRKIRQQDPNLQVTIFTPDKLGRTVNTLYASGDSVTNSYDDAGRLTQMQDATGTTTYSYDSANRQTGVDYPDGHSLAYSYDYVGNRIGLTDSSTGNTTYGYDDGNRLTGIANPFEENTLLVYDAMDREIQRDMANGTSTLTTYDFGGRLTDLVHQRGSTVFASFHSEYDAVGNRLCLTENIEDVGSTVTNYTYDDMDQLLSESREGEVPFAIQYAYDEVGNRSSETENGYSKLFNYDDANRLLHWQRYPAGSSSASSGSDSSLSSEESPSEVSSFIASESSLSSAEVTSESSLSSESSWSAASSPEGSSQSSSEGVLLESSSSTESGSGGSSSSSAGPTNNATYTYDANGNRLTQEVDGIAHVFSWKDDNRMTQWSNESGDFGTFTLDGDGLRRSVSGPDGTSGRVWDGDNLLQETDASGNVAAHYTDYPGVWGGLVSQKRPSGSRYYYFDPSGNTRLLTDASGTISDHYVYTAYGDRRHRNGDTPNAHGFGGQVGYQEDEDGRHYIRERIYDAKTGTFASSDPIKFGSIDEDFYRYARNNPANGADPSGLDPRFTTWADGNAKWTTPAGAKNERERKLNFGPVSRPGEKWRIFYIFAFKDPPQYLIRKTGGEIGIRNSTPSVDQALKEGLVPRGPNPNLSPFEHVLNLHDGGRSPYLSASTLEKGADGIRGEPIWIDVNKLRNEAVISFDEIVKSSEAFLGRNPAVDEMFKKWKAAQAKAEGEVLIKGAIDKGALYSRSGVNARAWRIKGGKALFMVAVAGDTMSFFTSANKSRELARISGGWTGSWLMGTAGARGGFFLGGKIGLLLGAAGPQGLTGDEVATVPVGAVLGGAIGGFGGGLIGYSGGGYVAERAYEFIQQGLRGK